MKKFNLFVVFSSLIALASLAFITPQGAPESCPTPNNGIVKFESAPTMDTITVTWNVPGRAVHSYALNITDNHNMIVPIQTIVADVEEYQFITPTLPENTVISVQVQTICDDETVGDPYSFNFIKKGGDPLATINILPNNRMGLCQDQFGGAFIHIDTIHLDNGKILKFDKILDITCTCFCLEVSNDGINRTLMDCLRQNNCVFDE